MTMTPMIANLSTAGPGIPCPNNKSDMFIQFGDHTGLYNEFTIRNNLERYSKPIWLILGIPGTVLSFIVWTRKSMRQQSSSVYLATLALVDCFFLLFHILMYLYHSWQVTTFEYPVLCEMVAVGNIFFQYLSPLLTLGFTVERYISICYPFRNGELCTTSRAVKVTLGLIFTSLVIASVQSYFFTFQEINGTWMCSERPELTDSKRWQYRFLLTWNLITETLIFALVPFSILVVNILVIREIRRIERSNPHGAISANTAATTVMLLTVSFYQISATLPVTLCQLLIQIIPDGERCAQDAADLLTDPKWRTQFQFINAKTVIESLAFSHYVAKFYIYLATGQMFRRQLFALFTQCSSRTGRPLSTKSTNNMTMVTTIPDDGRPKDRMIKQKRGLPRSARPLLAKSDSKVVNGENSLLMSINNEADLTV